MNADLEAQRAATVGLYIMVDYIGSNLTQHKSLCSSRSVVFRKRPDLTLLLSELSRRLVSKILEKPDLSIPKSRETSLTRSPPSRAFTIAFFTEGC